MTGTIGGDHRQASYLSKPMTIILLCLRLVVGWHFFYEGLAKLLTPTWTAASYLLLSHGIFSGFFHWLASSPGLVRAVDRLNIWGLILIGLALILGCFSRFASASGIVLLVLYYLAYPPLIQTYNPIPVEGHYLLVDKNVVELLALVIFLALPSGTLWGLDRLVRRGRSAKAAKAEAEPLAEKVPEVSLGSLSRRKALEDMAAAPILGVLGYSARQKYEWEKLHAITGATVKLPDLSLKDLKGQVPQGTLGKFKISRLILGGNLTWGLAHARDLLYVNSLFLAYNTERRIFDTFELAERVGINAFFCNTGSMPMFNKYRKLNPSTKMMLISQTNVLPEDLKTDIDKAIDCGATVLYILGGCSDQFVRNKQIDRLGISLDYIKSQGYLAGIGAHAISVPIECEKAGLQPDFYVKTLHHDKYWSAHPREDRIEFSVEKLSSSGTGTEKMPDHNQWHDNMFDLFPEKNIEFMATVKRPWIAFKVLAGGAISPPDGFKFAFENGADFICVGMFDFQLIQNVNTVLDVLANVKSRPRPWCA